MKNIRALLLAAAFGAAVFLTACKDNTTENPKESLEPVFASNAAESAEESGIGGAPLIGSDTPSDTANARYDDNISIPFSEKNICQSGDFSYYYDSKLNGAVVCGYDSNSDKADIPCQLGEYAVVGVDLEHYPLTEINMPDTVKELSLYKTSLKKANYPAALSLAGSFGGYTALEEVTFSEDVTCIKSDSFKDCALLESVTLPDSIEYIGSEAFFNCTSLKSVELPENLSYIGESAFEGCTALESASFGSKLKNLSKRIFAGCSSLKNISLPDGLEQIGSEAFLYCQALSSAELPDSIKNIGDSAFYCCAELSEIKLPNGLNRIGARAFMGCKSLTEITIPPTVLTMDSYVFADCCALKKADFSEGLTILPYAAFIGCYELESVTLPSTLTEIGDEAFRECTKLTETTLPPNLTRIGSYAFFLCAMKSITLPDGLKELGNGAFSNTEITEIIVPDSVTDIGKYAFCNCHDLTKLSLPKSIKNIPDGLASGCSSLEELELPQGIERIGNNAFVGCKALSEINIPQSVSDIGYRAFAGCGGISFNYRGETLNGIQLFNLFGIENGMIIENENDSESKGNKLTSVLWCAEQAVIPDGVTDIDYSAFRDCRRVTYVTIPKSVSEVYVDFSNCTELSEVIFEGEIREIYPHFGGCGDITFTYMGEKYDAIAFFEMFGYKDGLNYNYYTLDDTAYLGSSLWCIEEAIVSEKVTEIREAAFAGCNKLTRVVLPDSLEYICGRAFENCGALCEINIPNSVKKIDFRAFADCESLKDITLPDGLEYLAPTAFEGCGDLTVTYKGVKHSGTDGMIRLYNSFGGRDGMFFNSDGSLWYILDCVTDITIPDNVEEIFHYYQTGNLQTVRYRGNTYTRENGFDGLFRSFTQ